MAGAVPVESIVGVRGRAQTLKRVLNLTLLIAEVEIHTR